MDSVVHSVNMPEDRKVAILFGIDRYTSGVPALRNAVRDVQAVAGILRDYHGYATQLFTDEAATLTGLRAALAKVAEQLGESDRLILYFAGHGIAEEPAVDEPGPQIPQGFLVPQDARRDDPASLLPMKEVQQILRGLRCRHMLLFLDCCFAGAFRWGDGTRSLKKSGQRIYKERYERYLRSPAWQVITSAAHDERALDVLAGHVLGERGEVGQNSPFARAVCEGLGKQAAADLAADQVILASELHLYLESQFAKLEAKTGHRHQKPMFWSFPGKEKGEFVFPIPPDRPPLLESALELSEQNNPYRGLNSYTTADKDLFFGRQRATEELYEHVTTRPLTIVVGASGAGKSSLVLAGLIPYLQQDKARRWRTLEPQRPGKAPIEALGRLTVELHPAAGRDLAEAVAAFLEAEPETHVLLTIDQLEELLTQGAKAEALLKFWQLLEQAIERGGARIHVVATLRLDFEVHFSGRMTAVKGPNPRYPIPPMNREELMQVVEWPAQERVLFFEPPELIAQLVDEVLASPGALPLLSFAMAEMYKIYVKSGRQDRTLRAADYEALGGVSGSLGRCVDAFIQKLDTELQKTLQGLLLRLVSLDGGQIARRRLPNAELQFGRFAKDEQARVNWLLGRLIEERLVVSDCDETGSTYYEAAHDRLLYSWGPLLEVLEEDREFLLLLSRFRRAAADWVASGRASGKLWDRDPQLTYLGSFLMNKPEIFNAAERNFLASSDFRKRVLFPARVFFSIVSILGLVVSVAVIAGSSYSAQEAFFDEKFDQERRTMKREVDAANQRVARVMEKNRQVYAITQRPDAADKRADADMQRLRLAASALLTELDSSWKFESEYGQLLEILQKVDSPLSFLKPTELRNNLVAANALTQKALSAGVTELKWRNAQISINEKMAALALVEKKPQEALSKYAESHVSIECW